MSFVRLSEWFNMLSASQRKEISAELNRNARATHDRYKKAYAMRKDVRKRINKADIDNEMRNMLISAYRTQLPDMDFGSLDLDLVDTLEPILDFDPERDELSEWDLKRIDRPVCDESWIDEVFNNIETEHDDGHLNKPSDKTNQFLVRKLVHSKWIDEDADNIPEHKKPPDKCNIQQRYKLTLNAMQATRLNSQRQTKEEPGPWKFEGYNWSRDADGSWAEEITPETQDSMLTDNQESYANYAKQTGTIFHKCAASPAATPPLEQSSYLRIQSDQDANANITDNLDALTNIQWITPTVVQSADKESFEFNWIEILG